MCRYGLTEYKYRHACFACRKAFKQHPLKDWPDSERLRFDQAPATVAICPDCGQSMVDIGRDFKPPRRSNLRQWKKVELLYRHGISYHGCGCGGPGYRPRYLGEVPEFISEHRRSRQSEGERLLNAIAARTGTEY